MNLIAPRVTWLVFSFLVTVFIPQALSAALEFERLEIPLTAPGDGTVLSTTVRFRNSGGMPIRIMRVEPACNCTTVRFDKQEYAPSENGVVTITVNVGMLSGRSFRRASVFTNEPNAAPYILTVDVNVAPLATIDKTLLTWARDGGSEEQIVLIKSSVNTPIRTPVVFTGQRDYVSTVMRENIPGKEYALIIKPLTTRRPFDDRIDLNISVNDAVSKSLTLYVRGE